MRPFNINGISNIKPESSCSKESLLKLGSFNPAWSATSCHELSFSSIIVFGKRRWRSGGMADIILRRSGLYIRVGTHLLFIDPIALIQRGWCKWRKPLIIEAGNLFEGARGAGIIRY